MHFTRRMGKSQLLKMIFLLLCVCLSACVSFREYAALQVDIKRLEDQIETLNSQHSSELSLLRDENLKLWSEIRCSNRRVADFIAEAKQCNIGQCPQRNLERVLAFMVEQKHVLIRLRPKQPVAEIATFRKAQLQDLLQPSQLTRLSHIVTFSMTVNVNTSEGPDLAEKKADDLLLYIRRTLRLAPSTPRIGPFPVYCENKGKLLEGYVLQSHEDVRMPEEPHAKEPQVATWIFRVDC